MVKSTKEIGKMESNMGMENILTQRKMFGKKDIGMMVKESDGLILLI
jgi:hypothetical protein